MVELELSSHAMSIINWDLHQKIQAKKRRLKLMNPTLNTKILKIDIPREISLLEILILLNNESKKV